MEVSISAYFKFIFSSYYRYIILIDILIIIYLLFKKKSGLFQNILGFFLITTICIEFGAAYIVGNLGQSNTWLYNIYNVIEIDTYLFLSYHLIKYAFYKRIIAISIIIYTIVCLINFLFIQKQNEFHSLTYATGCILLVFASMLYFLAIFRFPQVSSIKEQPGFWFATALLFYYIASMPLFSLLNFFKQPPRSLLNNYNLIVDILGSILYLLIGISMVCHLKWNNIFKREQIS